MDDLIILILAGLWCYGGWKYLKPIIRSFDR